MSGIINRAARAALHGAKSVKRLIKSSSALNSLLYDLRNRDEFSDLYEHEKMLADRMRVDAYAAAIERHINPGDTVIDLGTGTGILAMLAARRGAKVYALDHSDFITVAAEAARINGLDNITFIRRHSKDFIPPQPVDMILHEQIGDDLFNENMIANLLDLKCRALKKGGLILPAAFELYLEPMVLKDDHRVPFIWEEELHGIHFGFTKDHRDIAKYRRTDYGYRTLEAAAFDYLLSKPEPALKFDLNTMEDGTTALPRRIRITRRTVRSGRMDGVGLYFRVKFDDQIAFDTAPFNPHTNWGNRLYRLPGRAYLQGEIISYTVELVNLSDAGTWKITVES